jgi:GTP-binding protein HflX
MWPHLERLGGGIGTRGPGETQLETDRRIIQQRIQHLRKEIESVRRQRALQRRRRSDIGMPVIALVGYTNAGKSTLLNAISSSDVLVEDKLFATLDPTTRRVLLPGGGHAVFTDTVGFIQKLPATLVAAFRATLEGLAEADVLLHVVDIASDMASQQCHTVENLLDELEISDMPRLLALNKIDKLGGSIPGDDESRVRRYVEDLGARVGSAALISADRGWGLGRLLELIEEMLGERAVVVRADGDRTKEEA